MRIEPLRFAFFFLSVVLAAAVEAQQIISYRVEIEIDRQQKNVRGVERIRVLPASADFLTIPLAGQTIDSVTLAGSPLTFSADPRSLKIDLPRTSTPVDLIVVYRASGPRGLSFGERSVYTGFDTCTWMICDPDPSKRAPLELHLILPAADWSIASGTLAAVEWEADRRRRFVWVQEEPYPAYLYGFVIGPLRGVSAVVDGSIIEVASPDLSTDELLPYLNAHRGMVRFFEEKAGMRIPRKRYAAVVVEGSAAQEKSSFSILGTAQLGALVKDETEDWLVAHELAHQFWGNLVTPESWQQMWISEGLVTFMTAAWKETRWGREKYDREIELAEARVRSAVSEGFDVPLNWDGEFPSLRLRRAIAYSRGALFFHTLRRSMGDEAFWRSVRSLTMRYRGRSVSSSQLQQEFERVSGRDLSKLFDEWVYAD